jgi:hypothetical protein
LGSGLRFWNARGDVRASSPAICLLKKGHKWQWL